MSLMYLYYGKDERGHKGVIVDDQMQDKCFILEANNVMGYASNAEGAPFEDEDEYLCYTKFMQGQEIRPGVIWTP